MAVAERLANNGQLAKNTRDPESATPRNILFCFILEYTPKFLSAAEDTSSASSPDVDSRFLLVRLFLIYLAENRRIIIHRKFSRRNRRRPGLSAQEKIPQIAGEFFSLHRVGEFVALPPY